MMKNTSVFVKQLKTNQIIVCNSYATLHATAVDPKHTRPPEWDRAMPFSKIPGPKTFREMREFFPGGKYSKISMHRRHQQLRNDYGDIVLFKGMLRKADMVLIYDPNDFELLHRTEGQWPIRNGMQTFQLYRNGENRPEFYKNTGGLVAEQGEGWAKFRNIVNPVMLQPRIVKQYVPKIDQIVVDFSDKIRKERDRNNVMSDTFGNEIFKWALESIAAIALEQRLGLLSEQSNPDGIALINAVRRFFELTYKLEVKPSFWRYFATPTYKAHIKNLDNLTAIVSKFLDQAVANIEKAGDKGLGGEESVLKKLIKTDRPTAYVMAGDMIIAGADTTGSLTTGLLFCLAKNPEKQQKLREEILKILPEKTSSLKAENMLNMPYMRAAIKEAIRLYPVAIGNLRGAGQDLVIKGYQIPKGTDVLTRNHIQHYDEKQFPQPDCFHPERWLKNNEHPEISTKMAHPFSFLPFGFGARMCIGRRFAELEVECLAARLVRNYYIGWNRKEDLMYKTDFINSPTGPIPFIFKDIEY